MERNFGLMEVSAKLGHGIKEAFNRLISEVYKFHTMELMQQPDDIMADDRKYSQFRHEGQQGSIILNPNMHKYDRED